MYNHGYSPDKVIRLDYGFGSDVDAVELGDGTLYLIVDLKETTWFGTPYKEACEVLSKYSMGFLVEDEMGRLIF